jgi:hypothetical protein
MPTVSGTRICCPMQRRCVAIALSLISHNMWTRAPAHNTEYTFNATRHPSQTHLLKLPHTRPAHHRRLAIAPYPHSRAVTSFGKCVFSNQHTHAPRIWHETKRHQKNNRATQTRSDVSGKRCAIQPCQHVHTTCPSIGTYERTRLQCLNGEMFT